MTVGQKKTQNDLISEVQVAERERNPKVQTDSVSQFPKLLSLQLVPFKS